MFKVEYINKSAETQIDVNVFVFWADYLEYVPGTTKLYNGNNQEGIELNPDNIANKAINIGDYTGGSNAVVVFEAKIKNGLGIGTNLLRNRVQIRAHKSKDSSPLPVVEDFADVLVLKI